GGGSGVFQKCTPLRVDCRALQIFVVRHHVPQQFQNQKLAAARRLHPWGPRFNQFSTSRAADTVISDKSVAKYHLTNHSKRDILVTGRSSCSVSAIFSIRGA